MKRICPNCGHDPNGDLTPTEEDILALLSKGKSLRQIARIRYTSYNTTRNQLVSIFTKLDAHSQIQAVLAWQKLTSERDQL